MAAKRFILMVAIGLSILATATSAISDGKDNKGRNGTGKDDKSCELVIRVSIEGTVTVKAESCDSFHKFPAGSKVDLGAFTGRQEGCAVLPTTGSPDCVSFLHEGNLFTVCN